MAGWSILSHGSGFDSEKGGGNCQSKVGCLDIDHKVKGGKDDSGAYEGKLKCLFDQVLMVFVNEDVDRSYLRPMPPMLGDGQPLDLFKLFWVVRERGGFGLVSVNGLWSFVVQDLGLDLGVSVPVKLVYHKYLNNLEECFVGKGGKILGNGECDSGRNLSFEVQKEFRGLLENWPIQIIKNDRLVQLKRKEKDRYVDMDTEESELDLWDVKNRHAGKFVAGKRHRGDDEKSCDRDLIMTNEEHAYRKRKRVSLSEMLNWVIQIATCPRDPSIRGTAEPSKWKELRALAIWARDAVQRKRHVHRNNWRLILQNSRKMHPSMYDDITDLSNQSTERLRYSGRLTAAGKSRSCSCCNPCSATESKLTNPCKKQLVNHRKKKTAVTASSSATNKKAGASWNRSQDRHVPLGPLFQASIPEWTGVVVESDPKWLGTQVWPLVDGGNSLVEEDSLGRGRPDSCGCPLPGSVNCVRFHIAEERMKLKFEIGVVFFHWRFDQMGEEVSLRWTRREEKIFKDTIIYDPPSKNKRFWAKAPEFFRKKTRKDLVSYFFNVFLVSRRSYQNRVTPKDIDTDDEAEFGSVSERFGHEAVTVPGSELLICSENRQCTDFE